MNAKAQANVGAQERWAKEDHAIPWIWKPQHGEIKREQLTHSFQSLGQNHSWLLLTSADGKQCYDCRENIELPDKLDACQSAVRRFPNVTRLTTELPSPQKLNFSANWICRIGFTVEVSLPKLADGAGFDPLPQLN